MTRHDLDAYMTPMDMVLPLFEHVDIWGGVLEPCAGTGNIVHMLQDHPNIKQVFPNDINPDYGWEWTYDATDKTASMYQSAKYTWLVTNPPFNKAASILEAAWASGIRNIAMLLRITFVEPTTGDARWDGRKDILSEMAPYYRKQMPFGSPRPRFKKGGSGDSATTAWMVWSDDWKGQYMVPVHQWRRPGLINPGKRKKAVINAVKTIGL